MMEREELRGQQGQPEKQIVLEGPKHVRQGGRVKLCLVQRRRGEIDPLPGGPSHGLPPPGQGWLRLLVELDAHALPPGVSTTPFPIELIRPASGAAELDRICFGLMAAKSTPVGGFPLSFKLSLYRGRSQLGPWELLARKDLHFPYEVKAASRIEASAALSQDHRLPGEQAALTVTVTWLDHFTGDVVLTPRLPAGAKIAVIAPSPLTLSCPPGGVATGTFTLAVAPDAPMQASAIAVDAVSGADQASCAATLTVWGLDLRAALDRAQVLPGGDATLRVILQSVNGYAGSCAVEALPRLIPTVYTGISLQPLHPTPPIVDLPAGGQAALTFAVRAAEDALATSVSIDVTARSGALARSATLQFSVLGFQLDAQLSPDTVGPGGATTLQVDLRSRNGFTGAVQLSAALPAGVRCGGGSQIQDALTLAAGGAVTQGYLLTIDKNGAGSSPIEISAEATLAGHTHRVPAKTQLTVTDLQVSQALLPAAILRGQSTTLRATVSSQGGFGGQVQLAPQLAAAGGGLIATPPVASVTLQSGGAVSSDFRLDVNGGISPVRIGMKGSATQGGVAFERTAADVDLTVWDFQLPAATISPAAVLPGGAADLTVTVVWLNGFTGDLRLALGPLPAGLSATASSLTVSRPPSGPTATGTFHLRVDATKGQPGDKALSVQVTGAPISAPGVQRAAPPADLKIMGFSLLLAPQSGVAGGASADTLLIGRNVPGAVHVEAVRYAGFSAPIHASRSDDPLGNPQPVPCDLSFATADAAVAADWITIRGQGGGAEASAGLHRITRAPGACARIPTTLQNSPAGAPVRVTVSTTPWSVLFESPTDARWLVVGFKDGAGAGYALSPDGSSAVVVSADGGGVYGVTFVWLLRPDEWLPCPAQVGGAPAVFFSPDGSLVALSFSGGAGAPRLCLADVWKAEDTVVSLHDLPAAPGPDGLRVVAGSGTALLRVTAGGTHEIPV